MCTVNANGTMRERDDHTYGGVRHVHIEGVQVVAYDSTVHLPRMHTPVDDTQRMPKKQRSRTGKIRQDMPSRLPRRPAVAGGIRGESENSCSPEGAARAVRPIRARLVREVSLTREWRSMVAHTIRRNFR